MAYVCLHTGTQRLKNSFLHVSANVHFCTENIFEIKFLRMQIKCKDNVQWKINLIFIVRNPVNQADRKRKELTQNKPKTIISNINSFIS